MEDLDKPGEVITVRAGDVFRIDKGTTVKYSSTSEGKGTCRPF